MKRIHLTLAALVLVACGGTETSSSPDDQGNPGQPGSSGQIGSSDPASGAGGGSGTGSEDGGNPPGHKPDTSGPVDLRADVNRDGAIDFTNGDDDADEDTWSATHGAIFLANLDDDENKCPKSGTDVSLAQCFDAANETVDGADDLLDLARLKTKPYAGVPDGATGTITVSQPDRVRLFRLDDGSKAVFASGGSLTTADLKAGVELGIEAKDIVRDTTAWDGYVDVELAVTAGGKTDKDKVRLRVAPLMTSHHLSPALQTYVTTLNEAGSQAMRSDLSAATTAAGLPASITVAVGDQWTQDFFETAWMTMPGPGGAQQGMRVNIRSANEYSNSATNPLRPAGKVVFTQFRGKDVGAVQQYDTSRHGQDDTLNSFGNLETIPPYTLGADKYPLGRILRGSVPSYHPDQTFLTMMESQKVQPPVYIDTSWLLVGHVDETISFIKAPSARGWVLVANDAALAKKMLEDQVAAGHGDTPMFVGMKWSDNSSAQMTINQVLSDTEVMQASAEAVTEVDAQLAVIKTATGLTDAEIVRIPYLHQPISGYSVAFQPGTVNGIYVAPGHFVAPDPHGPTINGKDIFKDQMQQAFAPYGVTVHFAEDWDLYHALEGEVHCGTNTTRQMPDAKWWESGR